MRLNTLFLICILLISFGSFAKGHHPAKKKSHKPSAHFKKHKKTIEEPEKETKIIDTGDTNPEELLDFAKSNIGTPYLYASTNPDRGFDCSGFVTYVFNHFGITVPRGSADYAGVQHRVALENAQPGDLIFFTGTASHHRHTIGHMGIVVKGYSDTLQFIHSTSGKENGVTISVLNARYMARLVKIIRIFPEGDAEIAPASTAEVEK